MNTDTHTPEPWVMLPNGNLQGKDFADIRVQYDYECDDFPNGKADLARAVACVNACAGMADPIVEITSLRNALRLAESALASLMWTPLTERQPAEDDGNEYHDVEWSDGKEVWQNQFTNPNIGNRKATHWRRITLP